MSFLDKYIKNHRLEKMSPRIRKNLEDFEKKLNKSSGSRTFEDAIREHGNQLADLIKRVSEHFDGFKITWKNAVSSFRFVISIATEVYQIVEKMKTFILTPGMSEEEFAAAEIRFGKNLVWFVWSVIDPLNRIFRWVPFKKIIEKRLVMWIAEMGLNAARNFFRANKDVDTFMMKKNNSNYWKAV